MYKLHRITRGFSTNANPFNRLLTNLKVDGKSYKFYNLNGLSDQRLEKLPFSIRVLLENAIRNCDEFNVLTKDVNNILDWQQLSSKGIEIPFKPARVILQDFTGVPFVVDLAALRDAVVKLGGKPEQINPLCPVDLVVDHSVPADYYRTPDAAQKNEEVEFQRNKERFQFLKWGSRVFKNFSATPPGSGIVHQVNLEYLARVVMNKEGLLYPDTVVGTDSHTTMINGLGVVGWGVGGIEATSVALGECISMVLPEVVGFKLFGQLKPHVTATDLVLTCTQMLRQRGVVGKFVEFFGPGCKNLNLADRGTIANMGPEYGATIGYFANDEQSLKFLKMTGRDSHNVKRIEAYLKESGLYRDYGSTKDPVYSGKLLELDLASVQPSISGPKRPHDRLSVVNQKKEWNQILTAKVGFKGYGLKPEEVKATQDFTFKGKNYTLKHGDVVLAAITSCTNTSNPDALMAAGLLAKRAVEKGLTTKEYIKTTLSPGSRVVSEYLNHSGVNKYLDQLGFMTAGYGCMTCIGNSGDFQPEVAEAITKGKLVTACVQSGNRNFEGRTHPLTRANYLASPAFVVAFAIAGTVNIDFDTEPIGKDKQGNNVFLKDIWPSREEVKRYVEKHVQPEMFKKCYGSIAKGTENWNNLEVPNTQQFQWDANSTYIKCPPYFEGMSLEPQPIKDIDGAYCILNLGDFITTDHISPAGNIAVNSPAAKWLNERGVTKKDFNSYGSRRGHDLVMARGTFANVRLINKLMDKVGPQTIHIPTNKAMSVYDAAAQYKADGQQLIILAGSEYGSGSSRDWAAKGPYLQGVKVVIAQSYERIHRSNLIGMGILPLEFKKGENAESLGLTGRERFSIKLNQGDLKVGQPITVTTDNGKTFETKVRLDTDVEVAYYNNGGILQYKLRKMIKQ